MIRLMLVCIFIAVSMCSCYRSDTPFLSAQDSADNLPASFIAAELEADGTIKLNSKGAPSAFLLENKNGIFMDSKNKDYEIILMKSPQPDYYYMQIHFLAGGGQITNYAIVQYKDKIVKYFDFQRGDTKLRDRSDLLNTFNEKIKNIDYTPTVFKVYVTEGEIKAFWAEVKSAQDKKAQTEAGKASGTIAGNTASNNSSVPPKNVQSDSGASQTEVRKKVVEVNEVTLCDELAAHPNDPNRMAKGVPLQDIVPLRAYNACKADTEKYPNTPRFFYQYGRAAEAMGKTQLAALCYMAASSMNYPMADYNIGLMYSQMSGDENSNKAIEFFQKAKKGGVSVADDALNGLVFSPVGFHAWDLLSKLYNNERIDFPKDTVLLYISSFIGPYYRSDAVDCRQLVQGNTLMKSVLNGTLGNLGNAIQNPLGYANLSRSAEDDALRFNERYGCTSVVTRKMFLAMQKWTAEH